MIGALYEINVRTFSLVCDGPAVHRKMLDCLGGDLKSESGTFPNPCEASLPVYGLLDVVHMLKLVRNSLSNYEKLIDSNGDLIEWRFIENLHKIQQEEGFRVANKLRKKHIKWQDMKMKVQL